MRMTVLASGSKGNSTVIASPNTTILVDAGLSCRELLKRMKAAGENPSTLSAILITHEHQDHVTGLAVLARKLGIPVYFTEPTHRAWVRSLTPRTTMTYAQWLDKVQKEKEVRAAEVAAQVAKDPDAASVTVSSSWVTAQPGGASIDLAASADPGLIGPDADLDSEEALCDDTTTARRDPTALPAVEYFQAGANFSIGDISVTAFTIPHDAADPCGFVFESQGEHIRMAIATDLGYVPPNVKAALRRVDVLLIESNHDLDMLKDGPYPWSVKQRVLSRVGHLSNRAAAEFLSRDYDGGAAYIVLGHLSEQNNDPSLALLAAREAVDDRMSLLGNKIVLAEQAAPLSPITL